jgi:polyhydroxyalkanoate synthesis repressor PhaR
MPRIIKRYENRKLYDTEDKKYISLADLREMIRQGLEVKVIDNVSGEDITTQTLTQVILEEGKKGKALLPSDILHNVIRWGSSFFEDSLKQIRASVEKMITEPLQYLVEEAQPADMEKIKNRINELEKLIERLEKDIERS